MSVEERLRRDLMDAVRARERGREAASVIRATLAALKNASIEKGSDLSDEEELRVLTREARQRQESLAEFERARRTDTVAAMRREMEILERYLPAGASDDEIRAIIKQALVDTGATKPGDLGKVMGKIMPGLRGRADGNHVRAMVKSMLESIDPRGGQM